MRFRLQALCVLSLFAVLALIPSAASAATGVVSCSTFAAALRDTTQTSPFRTVMKNYSSTYTNSATGQTISHDSRSHGSSFVALCRWSCTGSTGD